MTDHDKASAIFNSETKKTFCQEKTNTKNESINSSSKKITELLDEKSLIKFFTAPLIRNQRFVRNFYEDSSIHFAYSLRTSYLFPNLSAKEKEKCPQESRPTTRASLESECRDLNLTTSGSYCDQTLSYSAFSDDHHPWTTFSLTDFLPESGQTPKFSSRKRGQTAMKTQKVSPIVPEKVNVSTDSSSLLKTLPADGFCDPFESSITNFFQEFEQVKRTSVKATPSQTFANQPSWKDSQHIGKFLVEKGNKSTKKAEEKEKTVISCPLLRISEEASNSSNEIKEDSPPLPTYELYQLSVDGPAVLLPCQKFTKAEESSTSEVKGEEHLGSETSQNRHATTSSCSLYKFKSFRKSQNVDGDASEPPLMPEKVEDTLPLRNKNLISQVRSLEEPVHKVISSNVLPPDEVSVISRNSSVELNRSMPSRPSVIDAIPKSDTLPISRNNKRLVSNIINLTSSQSPIENAVVDLNYFNEDSCASNTSTLIFDLDITLEEGESSSQAKDNGKPSNKGISDAVLSNISKTPEPPVCIDLLDNSDVEIMEKSLISPFPQDKVIILDSDIDEMDTTIPFERSPNTSVKFTLTNSIEELIDINKSTEPSMKPSLTNKSEIMESCIDKSGSEWLMSEPPFNSQHINQYEVADLEFVPSLSEFSTNVLKDASIDLYSFCSSKPTIRSTSSEKENDDNNGAVKGSKLSSPPISFKLDGGSTVICQTGPTVEVGNLPHCDHVKTNEKDFNAKNTGTLQTQTNNTSTNTTDSIGFSHDSPHSNEGNIKTFSLRELKLKSKEIIYKHNQLMAKKSDSGNQNKTTEIAKIKELTYNLEIEPSKPQPQSSISEGSASLMTVVELRNCKEMAFDFIKTENMCSDDINVNDEHEAIPYTENKSNKLSTGHEAVPNTEKELSDHFEKIGNAEDELNAGNKTLLKPKIELTDVLADEVSAAGQKAISRPENEFSVGYRLTPEEKLSSEHKAILNSDKMLSLKHEIIADSVKGFSPGEEIISNSESKLDSEYNTTKNLVKELSSQHEAIMKPLNELNFCHREIQNSEEKLNSQHEAILKPENELSARRKAIQNSPKDSGEGYDATPTSEKKLSAEYNVTENFVMKLSFQHKAIPDPVNELSIHHKAIKNSENDLYSQHEAILNSVNQSGACHKKIQNSEEKLHSQYEAILSPESELIACHKVIQNSEKELGAGYDVPLNSEQKLSAGHEAVQNFQTDIHFQHEAILNSEKELIVKDKAISNLESELSTECEAIPNTEQKLSARHEAASNLEMELNDEYEAIPKSREELISLHESNSNSEKKLGIEHKKILNPEKKLSPNFEILPKSGKELTCETESNSNSEKELNKNHEVILNTKTKLSVGDKMTPNSKTKLNEQHGVIPNQGGELSINHDSVTLIELNARHEVIPDTEKRLSADQESLSFTEMELNEALPNQGNELSASHESISNSKAEFLSNVYGISLTTHVVTNEVVSNTLPNAEDNRGRIHERIITEESNSSDINQKETCKKTGSSLKGYIVTPSNKNKEIVEITLLDKKGKTDDNNYFSDTCNGQISSEPLVKNTDTIEKPPQVNLSSKKDENLQVNNDIYSSTVSSISYASTTNERKISNSPRDGSCVVEEKTLKHQPLDVDKNFFYNRINLLEVKEILNKTQNKEDFPIWLKRYLQVPQDFIQESIAMTKRRKIQLLEGKKGIRVSTQRRKLVNPICSEVSVKPATKDNLPHKRVNKEETQTNKEDKEAVKENENPSKLLLKDSKIGKTTLATENKQTDGLSNKESRLQGYSLSGFLKKIGEKIENLNLPKHESKSKQIFDLSSESIKQTEWTEQLDNLINDDETDGKGDSSLERMTAGSNVFKESPNVPEHLRSGYEDTPRYKFAEKHDKNCPKLINVFLSETFWELCELISSKADPFLKALQESVLDDNVEPVLNKHKSFHQLLPETTRFILNDLIKIGGKRIGLKTEDRYRKTLILHGFVKVFDLLVHCSFEACFVALKTYLKSHHIFIKDEYDELLERMRSFTKGPREGLVHPKATTIQKEIATISPRLKKDVKVLVVVFREGATIASDLAEVFGQGLVSHISEADMGHQKLFKLLEMKTLLVWSCEVNESLPLAQFSLVVEWESKTGFSSCLVERCSRQNIPVISLVSQLSKDDTQDGGRKHGVHLYGRDIFNNPGPVTGHADSHCEENLNPGLLSSTLETNVKEEKAKTKMDTYIFFASERVVADVELHYILTSVFNIELIERKLGCFEEITPGMHKGWADIVIDEKTCVLLQPLQLLRQNEVVSRMIQHLVLLYLQYINVNIILYISPHIDQSYAFRGNVVRALARLVSTCVQFLNEDYNIHLLYAYSYHQVGSVVRSLADLAKASSDTLDSNEWTSRPWLTTNISSHEKFLLGLPCINPITAQMMLTALPLSKLLTSSLDTLRANLPWIPEKIIQMFHFTVHKLAIGDDPVNLNYSSEDTDDRKWIKDSTPLLGDHVTTNETYLNSDKDAIENTRRYESSVPYVDLQSSFRTTTDSDDANSSFDNRDWQHFAKTDLNITTVMQIEQTDKFMFNPKEFFSNVSTRNANSASEHSWHTVSQYFPPSNLPFHACEPPKAKWEQLRPGFQPPRPRFYPPKAVVHPAVAPKRELYDKVEDIAKPDPTLLSYQDNYPDPNKASWLRYSKNLESLSVRHLKTEDQAYHPLQNNGQKQHFYQFPLPRRIQSSNKVFAGLPKHNTRSDLATAQVLPSPKVIMHRKDKQGDRLGTQKMNSFFNFRELTNHSEENHPSKKLVFRKFPGQGSQTRLVFEPAKT